MFRFVSCLYLNSYFIPTQFPQLSTHAIRFRELETKSATLDMNDDNFDMGSLVENVGFDDERAREVLGELFSYPGIFKKKTDDYEVDGQDADSESQAKEQKRADEAKTSNTHGKQLRKDKSLQQILNESMEEATDEGVTAKWGDEGVLPKPQKEKPTSGSSFGEEGNESGSDDEDESKNPTGDKPSRRESFSKLGPWMATQKGNEQQEVESSGLVNPFTLYLNGVVKFEWLMCQDEVVMNRNDHWQEVSVHFVPRIVKIDLEQATVNLVNGSAALKAVWTDGDVPYEGRLILKSSTDREGGTDYLTLTANFPEKKMLYTGPRPFVDGVKVRSVRVKFSTSEIAPRDHVIYNESTISGSVLGLTRTQLALNGGRTPVEEHYVRRMLGADDDTFNYLAEDVVLREVRESIRLLDFFGKKQANTLISVIIRMVPN